MSKPAALDFVLMRGGTSKGVFLRADEVPQDRQQLTNCLLDIFGSPDARQIDGLGGAEKLTSKAAIIGRPILPDTDVTYLFAQVGIQAAEVDFNLNCGNLTAAVGMYAIQQGYVHARDGVTRVRIHNLNTDKILFADVPVRDGEPLVEGNLAIGGVPGTGAPIALDFSRAAGAITGQLLPLGSPTVLLNVPGYGQIEVSVVDCANLVVFVSADTLDMEGIETPAQIDGNAALVAKVDAIRRTVAHSVGLGDYWNSRRVPSTPMCVIVQRPLTYQSYTTGEVIKDVSVDLLCRQYSTGATSKAMAATVTSCTGVACRIPGTVAARYLAATVAADMPIRIGHPSGIIHVESAVGANASAAYSVTTATIWRTARRIAEGRVFMKKGADHL
ncbi:3-methylitaconate isomerase [Pollutimonas subterranea]|uniref:3-methylitaconate isomerase n=1 Tax=Pollutimonas subterranea TaxID=2045210 RepID=A0A2N4U306_9BURK|nr:PrpF domain-containing protein [Pollutimonas subterranea]PLC49404.1 3-methylitaconate isomerase [Pollutimonas subterranea]